MVELKIVAQTKQDAKEGKNTILPTGTGMYLAKGPATMGILEGGMASGKTSVSFCAKDQQGKYIVIELSADLLEMATLTLMQKRKEWNDHSEVLQLPGL
jgi:hypothetical protein